jgi:CRP-like cAMP-binding protein
VSEIRIKLERIDVAERVRNDPVLNVSTLMRLIGAEVFKTGTGQRFQDRAQVFHQGDAGESLFFVLKGEVRLYADGAELGAAVRGEVVGEAEVLAGHGPRSYSAIAQGEVEVVELPRASLIPHLKDLARYFAHLRRERAARLKEMTEFLNRW